MNICMIHLCVVFFDFGDKQYSWHHFSHYTVINTIAKTWETHDPINVHSSTAVINIVTIV